MKRMSLLAILFSILCASARICRRSFAHCLQFDQRARTPASGSPTTRASSPKKDWKIRSSSFRSATQLAQVLVAGDVDIASLGGGPVMAASLSGADLKVIGNNVNKLIFSIHTKAEVKSIEELRGKRIAVSRFGSSADVAARTALRKHNMDPQRT